MIRNEINLAHREYFSLNILFKKQFEIDLSAILTPHCKILPRQLTFYRRRLRWP
jgi:hypothetical protein